MKTKSTLLKLLYSLIILGFIKAAHSTPPITKDIVPYNTKQRVNVLIGFKNPTDNNTEELIKRHNGKIKYNYHIIPAIAANIPQIAIESLKRNPQITTIEQDMSVYAIGELEDSWGISHIKANLAHNNGNTGQSIKVAVIDSGIDYNHIDLSNAYIGGYDFVNNDIDPLDDNGHGTHVSGIIAAQINNFGVLGTAPSIELYALKVLAADGSGYFSDIIAAIQWCLDNDIVITNNSYGSAQNPGTLVQQAFDTANDADILHIAAAGNSGSRNGRGNNVSYPAQYDSVVAVAAIDKDSNRASFSSTGDTVEISAPGVAIKSTTPNNNYQTWNGTSMASPHVAGAAALLWAQGITAPTEARNIITASAIDLGPSGKDPKYGYGLIDINAAINSLGENINQYPTITIQSPAEDTAFASNSIINFTATATDEEDGNLESYIQWSSSIDGNIGEGAAIDSPLSDGTHTITASVKDSNEAISSTSVNIHIGSNQPPTGVQTTVSSISYTTAGGKNNNKDLLITINIIDQVNNPIENAEVFIQLSRDNSPIGDGQAKTTINGNVTFKLRNAASGTYTTLITDIQPNTLNWDGYTPDNYFNK